MTPVWSTVPHGFHHKVRVYIRELIGAIPAIENSVNDHPQSPINGCATGESRTHAIEMDVATQDGNMRNMFVQQIQRMLHVALVDGKSIWSTTKLVTEVPLTDGHDDGVTGRKRLQHLCIIHEKISHEPDLDIYGADVECGRSDAHLLHRFASISRVTVSHEAHMDHLFLCWQDNLLGKAIALVATQVTLLLILLYASVERFRC